MSKSTHTVTMSTEDWNSLVCYIIMTSHHRKSEREAWETLAKEVNEDGSPVFKNAAANAAYYDELEAKLDRIVKIIEGRGEA